MQTTVLHNQTWVDMALQSTGRLSDWFDAAAANGAGITDDLVAGQVVQVLATPPGSALVVSRLQERGSEPASGYTAEQLPGGIGYMQIGASFIVN